ncbi:hypothetical protein TNCV_2132871 [Trichonephila clavipes]|nr:hypothetical protein TNCV_2132871 [Trichonephila clavipes]
MALSLDFNKSDSESEYLPEKPMTSTMTLIRIYLFGMKKVKKWNKNDNTSFRGSIREASTNPLVETVI